MSDVEPTTGDHSLSETFAAVDGPVSKFRQPWPDWRILALIAAHGLAGVIGRVFTADSPDDELFWVPFILCQCNLVGLWGALGRSRLDVRIVGMLAAVFYLGTVLWWWMHLPNAFDHYVLALLTTFPVAAITGIVRHFTATEARIDEPDVARDGRPFSIRSVMLLTIVIAFLLALGRVVAPYLVGTRSEATFFMWLGICSVFVALALNWAMLGLPNPVIRCLFVLFAIVAIAVWIASIVTGALPVLFFLMVILPHAFFLLVSLFVVRRCGYRLSGESIAVAARPVTKIRPPWPGWIIRVLIAVHGLASIVLAVFSPGGLHSDFVSLVLCQCSLVGLWGAMGRLRPVARTVGMLAAAAFLGTELCWWVGGYGDGLEVLVALYAFVLLETTSVAAIIWIARYFTATMRRIDEHGATRVRFHFSIRSLMLLTILIACLLTMGRLLASLEVLMLGICSILVAVASIWLMLGPAKPLIRSLVIFALSGSWLAAAATGDEVSEVFLTHAFFLLSSLFVIRRCGYRLAPS